LGDGRRELVIAGAKVFLMPEISGMGEKFVVDDWMRRRFLAVGSAPMPVLSKYIRRGEDRAFITFTDNTNWRNAGQEPVSVYATALNAGREMGADGLVWYTVGYPPPHTNMDGWQADMVWSARCIHPAQRMKGYPKTLTYRGLNNLATLVVNDREYFFLHAPNLLGDADKTVLAIPVVKERPAYLVNLESVVPEFLDPQGVGGMVGMAEWFWREEIQRQVQAMMQVCPLVLIVEKAGDGLAAIAAGDVGYERSRRQAEEKWRKHREEREQRGQQTNITQQGYFWVGGAEGWRSVSQLSPPEIQAMIQMCTNPCTAETLERMWVLLYGDGGGRMPQEKGVEIGREAAGRGTVWGRGRNRSQSPKRTREQEQGKGLRRRRSISPVTLRGREQTENQWGRGNRMTEQNIHTQTQNRGQGMENQTGKGERINRWGREESGNRTGGEGNRVKGRMEREEERREAEEEGRERGAGTGRRRENTNTESRGVIGRDRGVGGGQETGRGVGQGVEGEATDMEGRGMTMED
jgi:hypothetical protein